MRQYLILDVGTSSVRAALIDETLRILRLETARRTAPALFDAEAEWTLLHALMKTAASGAGDLAGVAVSALLGWVGTDARGNAVTPCFTYMHACPEEYAASPWDAEEAYRVCRRAPAPESGCFQLARVKARDPEAYGLPLPEGFYQRQADGRVRHGRHHGGLYPAVRCGGWPLERPCP